MFHMLPKEHPLIENIRGSLGDKEKEFLYEAARKAQGGAILEIGSWEGKSTCYLATGLRDNPNNNKPEKIVSIDSHEDNSTAWATRDSLVRFKENLANIGVSHFVNNIVGRSENVSWSKPLCFLWIDGDHSYKAAKLDGEKYGAYVIEGGIMAFHDATFGDVKQVVKELMFFSGNFAGCNFVESIVYGIKVSRKLTFVERVRNCVNYCELAFIDAVRNTLPQSLRNATKSLFKKVVPKF